MAIASTKWLRLTAGPGQIMKQAGLIPSMPHSAPTVRNLCRGVGIDHESDQVS